METVKIIKDIKVLYVTAKTFPDGIHDAVTKLHQSVPFSNKRRVFGLSRPEPENGGEIIYRAAAEEIEEGEAEKSGCETMVIKKGNYISLTVNDFRKDIMLIAEAFKELLKQPGLDPNGYCVEWYSLDREAVDCMIRLNE